MQVIPYSTSLHEQWDSFIMSHKHAWVGHHSAIFDLEKEFGAENISCLLTDDNHNVIGIMPLFFFSKTIKKVIPLRSIMSGSSLRNGPLLKDTLSEKQKREALDLLMYKIIENAKLLKADDIFVSYPVMHGEYASIEHYGFFPLKKYGFKENNKVTMIKDLRGDEQSLFDSLRQNCRKSIRRCVEEGGEFVVVQDRSVWMDCYELNLQTFSTENTKPYSKKTMEILWDNFVQNGLAEITAIRFKNKIISAMATAFMGNTCYPWIGFNSKPAPIPGGSNLLIWKSMLHFKERGVDYFEIGSREFDDDKQIKISAYKETFQGRDCYCLDGCLMLKPLKRIYS